MQVRAFERYIPLRSIERMGIPFGVAKIQIFFGLPEIPDIL